MSELIVNKDAKLRAREIYLIALAIEEDPCDLFEYACADLKLKE